MTRTTSKELMLNALESMREARHEITRVNRAAGETIFNPAATQALDGSIAELELKLGVIEIVIVRSTVTNEWGYCPSSARHLLRPELDDASGYPTAAGALMAARHDESIPRGTKFKVDL